MLFSLPLVLLTAPAARAQSAAASGTVVGHVTDPNSKLSVGGARVSVAGTPLSTYTDPQGNFSIANVPAGANTFNFDYVGYRSTQRSVTVAAGTATELNVAFDAPAAGDIMRLGEYKVTTDVIGSARAINEQRAAPALTNIIASDAIGTLPDKNMAEALQRVPGVDVFRDKGEGRYVNIRGLDPAYIGVSMNGIRMSTAEKGSREAALDTMSSTMIASMEVNKVNTPEMEADDMGGSVNIKTHNAFEQEGAQAFVTLGSNYGHQEDKHGGYNFAANYANTALNDKFGYAIQVASEYRPFTTYSEPGASWTQITSPTDGQQHWILGTQDFRHYDATRTREGIASALDYKLSDTTHIWVRYLDSSYVEHNQQWLTTFPFAAGTVQALTDTTATVSIKAGGIIKSMAQIANNKRVSSLVGGADTVIDSWTNNLKVGYTTSKYTRPTTTIAFANTAATVVSYAFNGVYDNTVQQVSGPSIGSPTSYAFSTKSGYSNTTANMHEETVRDDLRRDLNVDGTPVYIQAGVEYRNKNNNIDTSKWAITSLPATPWSSLADNVYPGYDVQDTKGSFPNFQIRQESVADFAQNGSRYGQTLTASTTFGGAFQALEDISAGYVEGGVTLGKLKAIFGARSEYTHFYIQGWQFDSTTAVATPVHYTKNYTDVLPDAIFTYEITPNTIARASWTNSLARPNYNATAPGRTVNDTAKTVSQGNALLDPLTAMNWDASLEHYYSPLGLVSASVYYKSIKNFSYQAQSPTPDPITGYTLSTFFTGPSAYIYGVELSWAQRLAFLPGIFSGLGVQANALLGSSSAKYPTRPGESIPFTGYGHQEGNAAVTYDYRNLHLRAAVHWHDKRILSRSVIGVNATQDEHEDAYHTIDAGASYSFLRHWQVYLNGSNLNNAPLREYFAGPGASKRIDTIEAYGWSAEGGVRWNY